MRLHVFLSTALLYLSHSLQQVDAIDVCDLSDDELRNYLYEAENHAREPEDIYQALIELYGRYALVSDEESGEKMKDLNQLIKFRDIDPCNLVRTTVESFRDNFMGYRSFPNIMNYLEHFYHMKKNLGCSDPLELMAYFEGKSSDLYDLAANLLSAGTMTPEEMLEALKKLNEYITTDDFLKEQVIKLISYGEINSLDCDNLPSYPSPEVSESESLDAYVRFYRKQIFRNCRSKIEKQLFMRNQEVLSFKRVQEQILLDTRLFMSVGEGCDSLCKNLALLTHIKDGGKSSHEALLNYDRLQQLDTSCIESDSNLDRFIKELEMNILEVLQVKIESD